jgi:hypothetical protein
VYVSREGNGEVIGLKRKGMTANWSELSNEEIKITVFH